VPRVQRRTPGERVAKNHHVRRQFRRPRGFPLGQNLTRCCTQHNRVPKFRLFRAPPPESTHSCPPSFCLVLFPSVPMFSPISKRPDQLRLDCVRIQAGQEPERGDFLALWPLGRRLASRRSTRSPRAISAASRRTPIGTTPRDAPAPLIRMMRRGVRAAVPLFGARGSSRSLAHSRMSGAEAQRTRSLCGLA
jgi:hypothetical protein